MGRGLSELQQVALMVAAREWEAAERGERGPGAVPMCPQGMRVGDFREWTSWSASSEDRARREEARGQRLSWSPYRPRPDHLSCWLGEWQLYDAPDGNRVLMSECRVVLCRAPGRCTGACYCPAAFALTYELLGRVYGWEADWRPRSMSGSPTAGKEWRPQIVAINRAVRRLNDRGLMWDGRLTLDGLDVGGRLLEAGLLNGFPDRRARRSTWEVELEPDPAQVFARVRGPECAPREA